MPLTPLNHAMLHQDSLSSEFCEILSLSDLFSGLVTCGPGVTLQEPRFNTTTGLLEDQGWYTERDSTTTYVDHEGIVREMPDDTHIFEGGRGWRNLAAATATPATQDITVEVGRTYQVQIGATSASGSTAVCSGAFSGTLTGDAVDEQALNAAGTATTTTLTVTITGAVTDLQVIDTTGRTDPDIPDEYMSVGVGYGDDLYISNGWIDSANGYHTAGVETFTWDGGQPGYDNIYQNLGLREDLYYTCVYTISGATAGTAGIRAAGGDSSLNGNGGPYTAVLQAGSNKNVEIRADSAFDGVISAVSIKKATTGIGWSNRDLSNTSVTDNVVTHAPGALISPAPEWRYEPAATNIIEPSTPNSTDWVFRGTVTGTNVDEGHIAGLTCQVRGLGASGVDDFYIFENGHGASTRIEPSCLIKAVDTSGTLVFQNAWGDSYGEWLIDLSKISITNFDHITRNHAAVTVNTEFSTQSNGNYGLIFSNSTGALDFDILGCQSETGVVSTSSIPTTTTAATRATDNILHDYSASVFDTDEGSLYLEIELPIDTDDLAVFGATDFFRGGSRQIAYRNSADNSRLRSTDDSTSSNVNYTNVPAGTPMQIRTYWSKKADQRAIGVSTQWDLTPAGHVGFTGTILELLGSAEFPVKIRCCKVIDAPLLPAAHKARFKIPFYQYKEWETVWDLSSSAEFSYTASGSGVVEYDVTDPYSGLPAVKWSNLTLSDTLTESALSDSNKFIFNTITDDPIALRVSFKYPGNSLRIVFGQSGGFGLDYIRRYIWSAADSAAGHRALITHFDLGQDPDFGAAQEWGTGNGPLNGEIDRVQIQLIGAVPAGQEVYISTFAKGGRERTKIMFGLDNHVGQTSGIYDTIFADMQAQGFKGYMGWSNGINPWDHVDDLPQTLAMQAAGWTICNHSYSHLGAETEGGGAYAFVVSDYTQQAEALESDGFGSSGRKYVIMPRNELSAEAKQAFEDMGYSYVRQKAPRYISRALVEHNPYEMGTINIGNGMAAADIEYYIDAAILLGVSLDLFTHAIGASGDYITQANWDAFMAHLILRHSEGLIDVVSKEEWDAGL